MHCLRQCLKSKEDTPKASPSKRMSESKQKYTECRTNHRSSGNATKDCRDE